MPLPAPARCALKVQVLDLTHTVTFQVNGEARLLHAERLLRVWLLRGEFTNEELRAWSHDMNANRPGRVPAMIFMVEFEESRVPASRQWPEGLFIISEARYNHYRAMLERAFAPAGEPVN